MISLGLPVDLSMFTFSNLNDDTEHHDYYALSDAANANDDRDYDAGDKMTSTDTYIMLPKIQYYQNIFNQRYQHCQHNTARQDTNFLQD